MESPCFKRVLMALTRERPDRVPKAELGIDLAIREAFLGRKIAHVKDEIEFWQRAGYDYLLMGRELLGLFPGISYGDTSSKKEIHWAKEGRGVIETYQDFKEYPWPDSYKVDYEVYERVGSYLPLEMKVILYCPPIFQWIWMLMGFENFSIALVEKKDLIAHLFEKIGSIRLKVISLILEKCKEVGALWMLDDIAYSSGLMVSPSVLEEYLFPWFKEIKRISYSLNLPLIYHSDGDFFEVLPDLLELGVDAIHPIESKGMGANPQRLIKEANNKMALLGGIDLDTLIRGTPDDIIEETRLRITQYGEGGGYLAGSSNSIASSVSLENYKAMLMAIDRYGTYV